MGKAQAQVFPSSLASDPEACATSRKGPHQPWAGAPRTAGPTAFPSRWLPAGPARLSPRGGSLASSSCLWAAAEGPTTSPFAASSSFSPPQEAGVRPDAEEVHLASHATSEVAPPPPPILPNSRLTPTFRASPLSSLLGHLPATPCPVPRQAEGSRPCHLKAPVTLSCPSFPALFHFLVVATSPAPCSGGRGASTLQSLGLSGLQWPGVFSRWEMGCGPASLGPGCQWGSCLLAGEPWGLLIPLGLSVPICEVRLWRSMGQGWGTCPQVPASCRVRAEGRDGCPLAARRRP